MGWSHGATSSGPGLSTSSSILALQRGGDMYWSLEVEHCREKTYPWLQVPVAELQLCSSPLLWAWPHRLRASEPQFTHQWNGSKALPSTLPQGSCEEVEVWQGDGEHGLWSWTARMQAQATPIAGQMSLGERLNSSVPQVPPPIKWW